MPEMEYGYIEEHNLLVQGESDMFDGRPITPGRGSGADTGFIDILAPRWRGGFGQKFGYI